MGRSAATTSTIESFDASQNPTLSRIASDATLPIYKEGTHFRIIGYDTGAELSELPIFTTVPGTIRLQTDVVPAASCEETEGVPGCFVVHNVLTPGECDQIVKLTETFGFTEDGLNARWLGRRNENCLWLADDQLCNAVFERCRPLFPQEVEGGKVCGLNARWRVYKYSPGDSYVAHIDSSFPGSGLDAFGGLVRDKYGDRWSRLTCVIYLNDEFKGGSTRFFVPAALQGESPGVADVQAKLGAATCFFHGDHPRSMNLPHEGALLESGTKYVVRTDVLYMLSGAQDGDLKPSHPRQIGPEPFITPAESRPTADRGFGRTPSRSRSGSRSGRGAWKVRPSTRREASPSPPVSYKVAAPGRVGSSFQPWWKETAILDRLSLKDVLQRCSLTPIQRWAGAIVRGTLAQSWMGWDGRMVDMSTRSAHPFLMFPAADDKQNAFSLEKHRCQAAKVVPSVQLWRWLASSEQAWQMRGELELGASQLGDVLGEELAAAAAKGIFRATQVSVWAGKGGTRTPLHSDGVHALVFQVVGSKRFFLSTRADVEDAVSKGLLPEAVKSEHFLASRTEAFCVDGSLDEVHGLSSAAPARVQGELAVLRAGDCLIMPAGLYHDVECSPDQAASLSVTVRFALDEWNCESSDSDSSISGDEV
ncbi:unnamed protein product [Polarella glacialis]|uniref:JmjC domain-containing protein n=1 Tax=Polarella glacialis TaxID=89957 RepID=A0A813HPJ5_POLGL|nr:unnamed protein product [Polarella glacialis]